MPRNPFEQLYVSEQVQHHEFVEIFSSVLVEHAMPLFQPGHVVLSGVQGSGKTMLFKLLEPEVRIAYAKAGCEFPIPADARRFIGAKINVNTSRAKDFGNRRAPPGDSTQELMFGDFLNYFVVLDILRSVAKLSEAPKVSKCLGVSCSPTHWAAFTQKLSRDDIWEGYLSGAESLEDLQDRMRGRLNLYRRYINANDIHLNAAVASTKTSAGDPMIRVVECLRECGIVPPEVNFFVIVDQYEELAAITTPDNTRADYRSVVNKVLSNRNPTLSYRIGTRGYGWRDHINIFGTDARLERDRDYKLIELDVKLRRQEDKSPDIFPAFAEDVFDRRLRHAARLEGRPERKMRITKVLGVSLSPFDEAHLLAGDKPERILKLETTWPQHVKSLLRRRALKDPLSAKLGEAWVRQKGWDDPKFVQDPPWERSGKYYWRKERVEVALLQIAGIRKQRAILSGRADILALSGGNVLFFLSICQSIWDFAAQASQNPDSQPKLPIGPTIQTIGVTTAARGWLDRIPEDYGRSDDRFRLVQKLGETLSARLLKDKNISNPGQNGISVVLDDLLRRPDINSFLIEAVDYGNLVMTEHATRDKNRKRRRKFYLNPLYCPVYRIPYQRSKEPLYLTIIELESWMAEAGILKRVRRPKIKANKTKAKRRPKPLRPAPLLDRLETELG